MYVNFLMFENKDVDYIISQMLFMHALMPSYGCTFSFLFFLNKKGEEEEGEV